MTKLEALDWLLSHKPPGGCDVSVYCEHYQLHTYTEPYSVMVWVANPKRYEKKENLLGVHGFGKTFESAVEDAKKKFEAL